MPAKPTPVKQNTIAMVYDFDGTLSPQPMQEYTVLPKIGVKPAEFWERVHKEATDTGSDPMLTYMRLMMEALYKKDEVRITQDDFRAMASQIKYFPGVEGWFERVDAYVKHRSAGKTRVAHYIISAGQKEILEGVSIRKHFKQVYASEYHFNQYGVATFPKLLITDTSKTQFLFRINKGREAISESINEHMPDAERPIPFSNIIYLGDGMTDVPSMALTKKSGGHTVAVYNPKLPKSRATCTRLLDAGRVDFIAPADYRATSKLMKRVVLLLDSVIAGIAYAEEVAACKAENA
ncbi:MAG: haloacid dehalogenase-like hydrolase [Betaproteobacteria bacterium]|nr:haloacid dehalogenase-like hydrolase [Betaproteobacteria bacterium]